MYRSTFYCWLIFAAVILSFDCPFEVRAAPEKTKELYFSGLLIKVDPAKNTFIIRSKKKELVFAIDPHRFDITVNGSVTERSLKFAQPGDAVLGELSLRETRPYVTWVEFTRHAEIGKPVPNKPGFILSPYLPKWPEPWHHAEAMDARQFSHGDMVLDDVTGKVFLVP
jgi:hypothetical protein